IKPIPRIYMIQREFCLITFNIAPSIFLADLHWFIQDIFHLCMIYDVSYDILRAFVHYMYTAEALLDEQMASDLL
ncbi:hypothetical protein ACJX0J_030514, partial [Zea mays]